jgi:hypothetical protein
MEMAQAKQIAEGILIMEKYDPGFWISAEHDAIYGLSSNTFEISESDKKKLSELGWSLSYDGCWMANP